MRWVVVVFTALSGCESCDFSFGPIPVVVTVTPSEVVASVRICDHEYGEDLCQTVTTNQATTASPVPAGTTSASASWDGYAVCRTPELSVDVTAEGCAPKHVDIPRSRAPRGKDPALHIDVALDCSGSKS